MMAMSRTTWGVIHVDQPLPMTGDAAGHPAIPPGWRERLLAFRGLARIGPRQIGLLGLSSTGLIVIGCVASAIAFSGSTREPYSPLSHFIWELGERGPSPLAWAFNLGIAAGGVGLGVFRVLLARQTNGLWRVAFIVLGLIGGVSGALLGLYPMDDLQAHTVASIGFFNAWSIAIAIFSMWLVVDRREGFPRWLLVPSGLVLVAFLGFLGVARTIPGAESLPVSALRSDLSAVPVLEWLTMLFLLAWFTTTSLILLRREQD